MTYSSYSDIADEVEDRHRRKLIELRDEVVWAHRVLVVAGSSVRLGLGDLERLRRLGTGRTRQRDLALAAKRFEVTEAALMQAITASSTTEAEVVPGRDRRSVPTGHSKHDRTQRVAKRLGMSAHQLKDLRRRISEAQRGTGALPKVHRDQAIAQRASLTIDAYWQYRAAEAAEAPPSPTKAKPLADRIHRTKARRRSQPVSASPPPRRRTAGTGVPGYSTRASADGSGTCGACGCPISVNGRCRCS
jgi:transcriptional regulator with XRE-family HTH domain